MNYTRKHFDPSRGTDVKPADNNTFEWNEKDGRHTYVFAPRVTLAINIAMATGRPLLISGEPGSGKSTLAKAVAEVLASEYFSHVVTSKTQASDLLWTYDALRRLNDATNQGSTVRTARHYVEPGALWWAFDPKSAAYRGLKELPRELQATRRLPLEGEVPNRAVVLVDEIDKADPDVPNDLLEPFDLKRFSVRETGDAIASTRDTQLLVTTNGERELSPAFLRRCVVLTLDEPDSDWFMGVAKQWFPSGNIELHKRLAAEVMRLRDIAFKNNVRKPSTAEYLDTIRVCNSLGIDEKWKDWKKVIASVLVKRDGPGESVEKLLGD